MIRPAKRARTIALLVLMGLAAGSHARRPADEPGDFDYYAVALSWSPSFCATRNDPEQCAIGRRLGFVLHGLWPQYERGYPESCSTEKLPRQVLDRFSALFPSQWLAEHEWKKHGTCSGLDPAGYFALSGKLRSQVRSRAFSSSRRRPCACLTTNSSRPSSPPIPNSSSIRYCRSARQAGVICAKSMSATTSAAPRAAAAQARSSVRTAAAGKKPSCFKTCADQIGVSSPFENTGGQHEHPDGADVTRQAR